MQEEYDRAYRILEDNVELLDALAEALLEHESLAGEEIDWIIARKELSVLHEQKRLARIERDKANAAADESADDLAAAAPTNGLPEPA